MIYMIEVHKRCCYFLGFVAFLEQVTVKLVCMHIRCWSFEACSVPG